MSSELSGRDPGGESVAAAIAVGVVLSPRAPIVRHYAPVQA